MEISAESYAFAIENGFRLETREEDGAPALEFWDNYSYDDDESYEDKCLFSFIYDGWVYGWNKTNETPSSLWEILPDNIRNNDDIRTIIVTMVNSKWWQDILKRQEWDE